jgi:hypothetical protein
MFTLCASLGSSYPQRTEVLTLYIFALLVLSNLIILHKKAEKWKNSNKQTGKPGKLHDGNESGFPYTNIH